MVAGPYASGAPDPETCASNLRAMNEAALAVFRRGHVPVIGVNLALPVIAAAGEDHYDEIMLPLSLALAERCDAVMRIGGSSAGGDAEVARFRERGLPVFHDVDEIPAV
jgi:ADP-ribose pyrophosphatase